MTNPTSGHPAAGAAAGHWVLDPAHSSVRFRSKSVWNLITVKGEFGSLGGSGEVQPGGTAQGTLTVQTASLDTNHGKRDTHLRSADFFHSEEHPELVFTAASVTPVGTDELDVAGELTVRGTTRPLNFTARITAADANAVTLEAEVAVHRADFGMTWNQLGMIKGPTTVSITARYQRES
ncbi:YceI family protein [Streptomyces sp. NBC_01476]|uniref:YceI family protein n=1 Tax=Streptomyces sp. NBC_01476 TaxID=2903881 RepID=UPI002E35D156|nr:YceI family protein [Streptomyces sp. NBC_01476]